MTTEEKKLLLTDLCARLPYNLRIRTYYKDDVYGDIILHKISDTRVNDLYEIENCKPYLRPMDSMTEEEKKEYYKMLVESQDCSFENSESATTMVNDWLLSKGFDVRGLIPKGLAIAVTEENNPYKE